MKKYFWTMILSLAMLCVGGRLRANHIVGGELKMKSMGQDKFEISLIQFWEKKNLIIPTATTGGNRDPEADLYIYSKRNNSYMDMVTLKYQSTSTIEYQNKTCATTRSLETVEGTYTGTITLSSARFNDELGYYIVWERCCRNDDINNILDAGDSGMAFYLEFPPIKTLNSSPEFQRPNGQYICINRDFVMNMSATDVDDDELRYSLVTPIRGVTTGADPVGEAFPKASYPIVSWAANISLTNVIPGPHPLTVDQNGILHVTADRVGLYVFSIQCEEFRNGKRIGSVRRDFQLLVIDCNDETPDQPVITFDAKPVQEVKFCSEKPVTLETEASIDWAYQWQRNGLNIPGAINPTVMISDTGSYSVVKSFAKKCSKDTASSIVHVSYREPIQAIISSDKSIICEGEKILLLANGGIVSPDLLCSWSLDKVALPNNFPTIEVNKAGFYELKISDPNLGCASDDTITISIEKLQIELPEKVSVMKGGSTLLSPNILPISNSYIYSWSPPEGLDGDINSKDIKVAPVVNQEYTLNIQSVHGCSANASVLVNVVDQLHIPTAFSPNRDGLNDTFEIFHGDNPIEKVRVFNRWGEVIFNSLKGYVKPWDGTFEQKPVPAGVYPYIISTTVAGDFVGEVILLR